MKTKFFAALCFAAALFTSCSKDKNDEPKVKPTPETAQIKHFETLMPGYDSWIYVDLETGKYEQQEELGAREYRKYSTMKDYELCCRCTRLYIRRAGCHERRWPYGSVKNYVKQRNG